MEEEGRLIIAGNEPLLHPDFERILVLPVSGDSRIFI